MWKITQNFSFAFSYVLYQNIYWLKLISDILAIKFWTKWSFKQLINIQSWSTRDRISWILFTFLLLLWLWFCSWCWRFNRFADNWRCWCHNFSCFCWFLWCRDWSFAFPFSGNFWWWILDCFLNLFQDVVEWIFTWKNFKMTEKCLHQFVSFEREKLFQIFFLSIGCLQKNKLRSKKIFRHEKEIYLNNRFFPLPNWLDGDCFRMHFFQSRLLPMSIWLMNQRDRSELSSENGKFKLEMKTRHISLNQFHEKIL